MNVWFRSVKLNRSGALIGITGMSATVSLEPVEEVPSDCRVCHYDELGENAKARVPVLAADESEPETADVDDPLGDEFSDCDVVKFTEYYAISAN